MVSLFRKYPIIPVGLVCLIALAYVFLVPTPLMVKQKLEKKSLKEAIDIDLAARQYAREHGGVYPASLELLFPKYLQDHAKLVSPLNPGEPIGYTYTAPPKERTDSPDTVVIEDKFSADKYHERLVVYANSSAKVLPETP